MTSNNTWNLGMNQDISKLKVSSGNYFSAQNFKLTGGEGAAYGLINSKGQSICFKLPDVIYAIYKIDPQDYTGNPVIRLHNNSILANISVTTIENYSAKQLAELILADSSVITSVAAGDYTVQYNNNYVVIVGLDNPMTLVQVNGVDISPLVAQIDNPQIVGAINIGDKLGIYSTENTTSPNLYPPEHILSNINSTGQIWECEYDEDTNTILGLVNGTLVPSVHLKYHHNMNLTQYRKVSGEGRYEHIDYRCHYITDNFNNGRIFNLAASNTFATPLEAIDMKPIHFSSVPVIQSITDGGFIKVGRIQYFYQLQSDVGTETSASSASNLISLSPSALSSSYQAYQGGTQGANSGKSITLKIENIDTNFDRIKIGYILWEAESIAIVRYFFEGSVPPTGVVQIIHSGSENEVSFTLEQYRLLQAQWDVCKGFSQKKNILLAYNTRNNPFDVNIDCRAYRFNLAGEAHLYDINDTYGSPKYRIRASDKLLSVNMGTYGGTTGLVDWEDIPFDEDLINPYNNEDPNNALNGGDWFTNSQFKYQSDLITLGGEGPIIKYNFWSSKETFTESGDTIINLANSVGTGVYFSSPLTGTSDGVHFSNYSPGTGINYPISGTLSSMKNPILNSLFVGYADGEVYRFADVFFNNKFSPSFTKWIGDIKFPLQWDKKHESFWFDSINNQTEFRQQGLQFTLNTTQLSQSIRNSISGWSYVRVKRTDKDKTRLGTGIMQTLATASSSRLQMGGASNNGTLPHYLTFECPNFKFNIGNNFVAGDHIRFLKLLGTTLLGEWGPAGAGVDLLTSAQSIVHKYGRDAPATTPYTITDVTPLTIMLNVPVSIGGSTVPQGVGLDKPILNMSAEVSGNDNHFQGWGGYTHFISSLGTTSPNTLLINPTSTETTGSLNYAVYASYERYLANQYGLQWETRMGQQYIGCNHFQPWDNTLSGSITSEVFGGDVVNTMFDYIKIDGNSSATESLSGWSWDSGFAVHFKGLIFPAECAFDANLRQGRHLNNMTVHFSNPHHEAYTYNTAYSQQNEALVFLSEPYNFRTIEENPYRTWAAQEKFDGEFPNAWGKWLVNEYIDVEGTFGPINRIILNKDKVFFYQDYAIGLLAIKEQQALTQEGTTALVLGEGTVLQRYDYISKTTGCKHQWAVVNTPKGNYHFDATLKKIFMLEEAGDQFGLTDLKGLNVKFQELIQYLVKDTDRPLKQLGINAEWNPKFNEVYFTILDGRTVGSLIEVSVQTTISYNELTGCFDSFHSFTPTMYHRLGNHLLSIGAKTDNGLYSKTMFEHDEGLYNQYHHSSTSTTDNLFPSTLTFIVNGNNTKENWSSITKRFDVMDIITEVKDSFGVDVPLETISTIHVYNDYQSTGVITLTPQSYTNPGSIRRFFRTWRINYFRDATTNLPFLKDKSFTVVLSFSQSLDVNGNSLNHRIILHDVNTVLTPQQF